MTLESQHREYLVKNPGSTMTYNEWFEQVLKPFTTDMMLQVGNIQTKDAIITDLCEITKVHPSRVKGCYMFGSQVYGTANPESDKDFILIANSSSAEREFKTKEYNVHVIVPDLFDKYAHDNHVKAIECLFSPRWARLQPYPYEFVYREKSFRHNFSHQVSNSWVKCMKKLAQGDYYIGTKSLFHALRIIDLGIQFAQYQKDKKNRGVNCELDFSRSNHIWKEISSREWTWEELKEQYQPLRNSLLSQFKKLTSK